MKIYQAQYCSCIFESVLGTISLHKTKEGAEKAIALHKFEIKSEFDKMYSQEDAIEQEFRWDMHQSWNIEETELSD